MCYRKDVNIIRNMLLTKISFMIKPTVNLYLYIVYLYLQYLQFTIYSLHYWKWCSTLDGCKAWSYSSTQRTCTAKTNNDQKQNLTEWL